MKQLGLIILFFVALVFSAQAQSGYVKSFDVDTLTNADTLTFTVDRTFPDLGQYSFATQVDSLSGTTSATAYIEVSNAYTGDHWRELSNFGIGDSLQTVNITSGVAYAIRYRLRVISSGTQSTKVKPEFVFKRDR